jgi:putative membrane protein
MNDPHLANTLAVERNVMATDRTLMAWTRTSISMISFGFTVYKLLHVANKEGILLINNPAGPRNLGLFLIAIGTLSLAMGMLEHRNALKRLNHTPGHVILSPGFLVSAAVMLLGMFLFVTIILKMEVF